MNRIKVTDKEFGVFDFNGKPVVGSRKVAEVFEKRHDNVVRDIENGVKTLREIGLLKFEESNFLKSTYINQQNKKQPEYLLSKDGFSYIAMGFSGKKAAQFKVAYINRFNEMEQYILSLNTARLEFPELTRAIHEAHEPPGPHHFSNEMDMINRIVLGMTAKQYKESHGIGDVPSIRPYLTADQLKYISLLQKADIGLVLTEPDYQKRKRTLEWYFGRLQLKKLPA